MCDYGRGTFLRWTESERLATPKVRKANGGGSALLPASWNEAIGHVAETIGKLPDPASSVFLASGQATTEEAFALERLARRVGSINRLGWTPSGPQRRIPTPDGEITGTDAAPNRRGLELVGLTDGTGGGITAERLLHAEGAIGHGLVFVLDADFGGEESDPELVARLRLADCLVVAASTDSALARAADVVLPLATAAEKAGSFVNVRQRLQRFEAACLAPGQTRDGIEIVTDLLRRLDPEWTANDLAAVSELMAAQVQGLGGHSPRKVPAGGVSLVAGTNERPEEEE